MSRYKTSGTPRVFPVFSEADSDLALLAWRRNAYGYATRKQYIGNYKDKSVCAHRLVLSRIVGRDLTPKDICDHVNGDKLDNRRENLRLTDMAGNAANRVHRPGKYPRNVCKVDGGKGYYVSVYKAGKSHYGGVFDSIEAASEKAKQLRAELGFSERTNQPASAV